MTVALSVVVAGHNPGSKPTPIISIGFDDHVKHFANSLIGVDGETGGIED
jgi:hypothetical protein